jgi:hypothetical protein
MSNEHIAGKQTSYSIYGNMLLEWEGDYLTVIHDYAQERKRIGPIEPRVEVKNYNWDGYVELTVTWKQETEEEEAERLIREAEEARIWDEYQAKVRAKEKADARWERKYIKAQAKKFKENTDLFAELERQRRDGKTLTTR